MKENLTIVKVGGAVVEDEAQLSQLLKDFSAIEGRKVLVHGGGRKATKVAKRSASSRRWWVVVVSPMPICSVW